jgi:hypothetical protein
MKQKCLICGNLNKDVIEVNDDALNCNIGYICNDCNLSEELILDKVELISQGEVVDKFSLDDNDDVNTAMAALGLDEKQEDLLYVKFKLVHANTNKNMDKFLPEEMQPATKTPILKLINWGHKEPNIGVIYRSKYVQGSNGEDDFLECYGAISKYKYKTYAQEILNRYANNNLFFSMETYFKEAQCSVCDMAYADEQDYCSHLKTRLVTGKTSRVLRGLTFAGAAVVKNPADVEAEALALASDETQKNCNTEEESVVSLKKVNAEEVIVEEVKTEETPVEEVKIEVVPEVIPEVTPEVVESADELRIKLQETKDELQKLTEKFQTITQERKEIVDNLANLTKELTDIKASIAQDKLVNTRISELETLGYDIPEDEKVLAEFTNKVKDMDENSFSLLKELVGKNPVVVEDKKETKEETQTQAEKVKEVEDEKLDIPVTASSNGVNDKAAHLDSIRQAVKAIL